MAENACSQQAEQDCIGAIPICQNQYSTTQSYVGSGNNPNEIDTTISCLKEGEKNDVWYTFTVQTSGNLNFLITPVDPMDDYDWAVFNLTGANCADIFTNASLSVSCNYSQDPGPTGPNGNNSQTSATWQDPHFNAVIPVTAGETYVINVSNFSSSQSGYAIDFSSSTAQIFDNVAPQLATVYSPSGCGASSLTFGFSEHILFNSVQNSDFTLTGPGGNYTINGWSSPSQAQGATYGKVFHITVSPVMLAGNYTLSLVNTSGSVTDLCGNLAMPAGLNFTVNGISIAMTVSDVSCFGGNNGSVTANPMSGNAPYAYNWSTGAAGSSSVNGLIPGTYTVSVTDAYGCTTSQSAIIAEPADMIISEMHTDVTCAGGQNGSATITVQGGTPAYTYTFGSQTGSSAFTNNLPAGLNQVIVTDANGCQKSIQFVIDEPPAVVSAIQTSFSDTVCSGQLITLIATATGGTPGYTFNWNNGTYNEDSLVQYASQTTMYTVFATDSNGCSSVPQNITVNVYDKLSLSYLATAVCDGDSSRLSIWATGGNGIYNFNFMPDNLTGSEFTLLPDVQKTYIVSVTDGCQSGTVTDTIQFTIHPRPVSNFGMDITEGCAPLWINFSDSSSIASGSVASWNWLIGADVSSEQNPFHCLVIKGDYKIKLVAVSDFGCVGDTAVKKVKVFGQPVADFSADKDSKGIFHASFDFKDESVHAVSWIWNFGDTNDPTVKTIKNPTHTYSDTGSYIVTLVVFNAKGCSDTISQTVEVLPVSKLFLPDAFSPNGDGVNDLFSLKGLYISDVNLTIFDRWGKPVHQMNHVNDYWDGRVNGTELPIGVYSYIADIRGADGKRIALDGLITLVK